MSDNALLEDYGPHKPALLFETRRETLEADLPLRNVLRTYPKAFQSSIPKGLPPHPAITHLERHVSRPVWCVLFLRAPNSTDWAVLTRGGRQGLGLVFQYGQRPRRCISTCHASPMCCASRCPLPGPTRRPTDSTRTHKRHKSRSDM